MIQKIAMKTAEKMLEQSIIEAKKIRVYAYGLELLFSSLAGVVMLIIISAVYGKPSLWIPYLVGFIPLRLSGGGYHARTHFRCIFIFSLLYVFVLLVESLYTITVREWLIACLVNLVIIFLFSPVVAPNKPLKECQRRMNRRNSLLLGLANLFGCVVLTFLSVPKSQWVDMYFSGSCMAGLSMLLGMLKNRLRRRKTYENNG